MDCSTTPPRVQGRWGAVPHSAGERPPAVPAPLGAVDCHHHIFDARFHRPGQQEVPQATVDDYRRFKARLGITRSVFVLSSNYGDDNAVLLDALQRFGQVEARGVAIVHPGVDDATLHELHLQGVRGIRVYMGKGRVPTASELRGLAARAADRGWSLCVVGSRKVEVLLKWEDVLAALPCPVVIDHLGWAPQPAGRGSATAAMLRRLLAGGNTYVKLSGPYLSSVAGPPGYADVDVLATELAALAPDRLLWGSDWPHPGAQLDGHLPDGALLFEQLARWVPDEAARRKVLVDNPQRLYWAG